jgi:hypothetical protein
MRQYRVAPRDTAALTRAVQTYEQDHIKYLREHPETYASPARTLEWGVADCDDLTILTCAALRGAKVPCRAAFIGWLPKGTSGKVPFRHVYPEAWVDTRWVALEAVRKVPWGWDVGVQKLKQGYRVRRGTIGDPPGRLSDAPRAES